MLDDDDDDRPDPTAMSERCPRCGLPHPLDLAAFPCPGSEPPPPEPAVTVPTESGALVAGRFRVERLLGQGGVGAVYVAHDTRLDRAVAIKVIRSHHANDSKLRARFEREARIAAGVQHPGVVEVFDFGMLDDGSPYLVMELLDGESLETRLRDRGPEAVDEAVRIGCELLAALGEVHRRGVIHRDVKPANVFLSATDPPRVKLLDFGMGCWVDPKATRITDAGALIGTPLYMAPEQVHAKADERTDIYAVGATLYEMLTGTPPIPAEHSIVSLFMRILSENPEPPSQRSDRVPASLDAPILKALAKSPDDRQRTVDELATALRAAVS